MRFGTAIGVMVLATGVIGGVAASAVDTPPPAGQSKLEGPESPTAVRPKKPVGAVVWKQTDLAPEHALLKGLVGHWTTTIHVFEGSVAKSRNAEGTADGKALMGGLFVQLTQTETRAKQPYEGMKVFGFSEALNKYTADAIDTSATSSLHFVGTYDAATKKLTMSTHYSDDKLKSLRVAKIVISLLDDKTWAYEEFVAYSVGGPETAVVQILFKRA
jgi:hypothetical protein